MTATPNDLASRLRECPFCGGEAQLRHVEWPYTRFCVCCSKCRLSASRRSTEEAAILYWNTRPLEREGAGWEVVAALTQLRAFVAVMVGQGPDCIIPETVNTPLGPPVKIGAIMRLVNAALNERNL